MLQFILQFMNNPQDLNRQRLGLALIIFFVAVVALVLVLPNYLLLRYLKPELDRKERIPYENHIGLKFIFVFSLYNSLKTLVQVDERLHYFNFFISLYTAIYTILVLQLLFLEEIDPEDPVRKFVVVVSKFVVNIVYYPAVVIIYFFALVFLWTFIA